nr:hypothetical protein [Tanacetum cinerariifolium]
MERAFLSQKKGVGGRCVKEKQNGLVNDTTKDNVMMSLVVDEPVVASGNNKGTGDGNVGQDVAPVITTAPNIDSVPINDHVSHITDNSNPIRSGPTLYAKLVIGELSRKTVNFRILVTPVGNGADVVVPLESIQTISERFANTTYGFFLGKRFLENSFEVLKLLENSVEVFKILENKLESMKILKNKLQSMGMLIVLYTLVSAEKISRSTKDSSDATNTQTDENIKGLTVNVAANVIVSPIGPILFNPILYAKLATRITSKKSVNFRTLITPARNEDEVDVPLESIRAMSERFVNTTYGLFLGKWVTYRVVEDVGNVSVWVKLYDVPLSAFSEDGLGTISTRLGTPLMLDSYTSDMCIQSWGRLSYTRAMIDLRADGELKDTIVVAMPKLLGEGFNLCTIHVTKNLNNSRHATRGVPVGLNVSIKSSKQIYRHISNKNGASTSGKNKQPEVSKQEVSNSNPFDALKSIENDDDFGTNVGISKSVRKGSLNVAHASSSNTPIIDKIDKLQHQILDGKLMFVNDDGNPLVPTR